VIGATPDMTSVVAVRHGVIDVLFADGLGGELRVLERMRGPVFARARGRKGFAGLTFDAETATVAWPDGADLAPDTLYERVRTGRWHDEPDG
jgi:hypothetical protein